MIKIIYAVSIFLFATLCGRVLCQDIPAVTSGPSGYRGFSLPDAAGTLTFGLTATETARSGYYGASGESYATSISGNAGYLSNSAARPFRMAVSSGYRISTARDTSAPFVSLVLSQLLGSRNWTLSISDSVRYLPESPGNGFSGLPGLGGVGVPAPVLGTGGILSVPSRRVANSTDVGVSRNLTGSTSLVASGGYTLQRFVGSANGGIDFNGESGQAGIMHRINALSQIGANVNYTHFSYLNTPSSIASQTAINPQTAISASGFTVNYTRQWSRRLSTDLGGGPQRRSSTNAMVAGSPINFSANLSATYALEKGGFTASYVRGVQSGSGVIQGGQADAVEANYSRPVGEYSSVSMSLSYAHHQQLLTTTDFSSNSFVADFQVSRQLGTNFSAYASYSVQQQTTHTNIANTNGFDGVSHIVAAGITYSPRPKHFGH